MDFLYAKFQKCKKTLLKIIKNKKTWLFILCVILLYKFKYLPKNISPFQLIELLKFNSKNIQSIKVFNDNTIIVNTKECLMTEFSPIFTEEIFGLLKTNKIKNMEYFSGFEAFIYNPKVILSGLISLICFLTYDQFINVKSKTIEKKIQKDTDILNEFIANENVKAKIKILIDQIKNPQKYTVNNIKLIKGILLYGKPGTGKTLLANVFMI